LEINVIAVGTSGFPAIKILNQEYARNAKAHTGIDRKNDLTKSKILTEPEEAIN